MASRWSDIFEREPEREPELGPSHEPGPQPDSWFADKVEDVPQMQATHTTECASGRQKSYLYYVFG